MRTEGPKPVDHAAEVDALKAKIAKLEIVNLHQEHRIKDLEAIYDTDIAAKEAQNAKLKEALKQEWLYTDFRKGDNKAVRLCADCGVNADPDTPDDKFPHAPTCLLWEETK